MTEMQVYHETFEGISYVVLVVERGYRKGRIEPWDEDEMTVREKLDKLPIKDKYTIEDEFNIMGFFNGRKKICKKYRVYDATENLEGTISELRELNQDPSINLEISEGLPEVVKKALPLEFK